MCRAPPLEEQQEKESKRAPKEDRTRAAGECAPPHGPTATVSPTCTRATTATVGTKCPAHAFLISCVHHTIIHEVRGGGWLTAEPAASCGPLPEPPHSHLISVPRALPRCQWSSPFLSSSVSFHRSYSTTRGSTGRA